MALLVILCLFSVAGFLLLRLRPFGVLPAQRHSAAARGLHKPTEPELRWFLGNDTTSQKVYDKTAFDCNGFAIELRDNARDCGLQSAFVTLNFGANAIGHALNAFDVVGEGVVFIDAGL